MFRSKMVKAPKQETIPNLTSDDILKTRKYLLKNLRYYLDTHDEDEEVDDSDYIDTVCGIVDALSKLP